MARVRCFVAPEEWPSTGAQLPLSGREAHHLSRVLRVRRGEKVTCFDGRGRELEAVVQGVSSGRLLLQAGAARQLPSPSWALTLGVAVPGQGRLEEIVSSATQMGVCRLLPILTERTVIHSAPDRFERKRVHLQQVAVEAAKQSGMSFLPEIRPLTPWKQLLSSFSLYGRVLLASVEGPHEELDLLLSPAQIPSRGKLLLLIGPEGDFSPAEISGAVEVGARRFSLGPSVLRCETAAVAALALAGFFLRRR